MKCHRYLYDTGVPCSNPKHPCPINQLKETLFKEVHHRIKNNVAQVESLLSLQTDFSDDPNVKSALDQAVSRVRSTRILYEKLLVGKGHEEVSIKEYLDSLIKSHAEVWNDNAGVSIETSIVDFSLSSKKAIPLRMKAAHEVS